MLLETINYKGYDIEIHSDESCKSPDDWGNTDIFLVHDHRQFYVERKGFEPKEIYELFAEGQRIYDGYHIIPLYAYIHSGVALSLDRTSYPFTDRWDTSFAGFVLVSVEIWPDLNEANNTAQSLVEEWNMYLSGDVYGYDSEVGGCWGFYGSEGKTEMIEQAKSEIDFEISKKISSHVQKVKKWILSRVPIEYRKPLSLNF